MQTASKTSSNTETLGLGHRKGRCKATGWQCPPAAAFGGGWPTMLTEVQNSSETLSWDRPITRAKSHLWREASKMAPVTPLPGTDALGHSLPWGRLDLRTHACRAQYGKSHGKSLCLQKDSSFHAVTSSMGRSMWQGTDGSVNSQ